MKVGDLVRCTSDETGEKKIGIVSEIISYWCYRVYFANDEWNGGVWTRSAMETVCIE